MDKATARRPVQLLRAVHNTSVWRLALLRRSLPRLPIVCGAPAAGGGATLWLVGSVRVGKSADERGVGCLRALSAGALSVELAAAV